jgi:hypothetical protein
MLSKYASSVKKLLGRIDFKVLAAAAVAALAAVAVALPHFRIEMPQGVYDIHLLDKDPRRTEARNGATDPIYNRLADQAAGYDANFKRPYRVYSIIQYIAISGIAALAALTKEEKNRRFIYKLIVVALSLTCQIACMAAPPIAHSIERKSSLNSHSHAKPPGMIQTDIGPGLIAAAFLPLVALVQTTFLN